MKRVPAACAAALMIVLVVSSSGQAATSYLNARMWALRVPGEDPAYQPDYWSGAYAEAGNDTTTASDNQYDPSDDPWPNTPILNAGATVTGAQASAAANYATVELTLLAAPAFGAAGGYADVEQWLDFEISLPSTALGVGYEYSDHLVTNRPGEEAWFYVYGWAELDRWIDDNGDQVRDEDEWYFVDEVGFDDAWEVADGAVDLFSDSDVYWFDPVGPGVYSLGLGGEGEVDAVTIPAPGALLLAALGAALVGSLRRRATR